MVKRGKDIIWQVIESQQRVSLVSIFFEEDAHKLAKFQNQHKVWKSNGGVPKFLWTRV